VQRLLQVQREHEHLAAVPQAEQERHRGPVAQPGPEQQPRPDQRLRVAGLHRGDQCHAAHVQVPSGSLVRAHGTGEIFPEPSVTKIQDDALRA
jgi:hypothetical protein